MNFNALPRLKGVYADYEEAYRQSVIDGGALHNLQKFVVGDVSPAERKRDTDFYKAVQAAVSLLANAEPEHAEDAARFMLLEAEGADQRSDLMLQAAQALAIPLIPHMDRAAAGALLSGYQARYPKKRLLSPKQKELVKALEKAAK